MTDTNATQQEPLTPTERIDVLMEEYRVLYGLVTFRMSSLDRRIAIAWAGLAGFVASFIAVDAVGQYVLLAGLPLGLVWLVRTTNNHARSFEDVLRRIDEIERRVNGIAGAELLAFQSRHPSKRTAVGGRTGSETVRTVYMTCLAMLVAATTLLAFSTRAPSTAVIVFGGYAMAVAMVLFFGVRSLERYRYEKRPD